LENYKNLLFPKQENHYQFLFPIGKIGKANGHPVPFWYLMNKFGSIGNKMQIGSKYSMDFLLLCKCGG